MIVKSIRIVLAPGPNEPDNDGVKEKLLTMDSNLWDLPSKMFPRELRFVSGLEALVNEFNKGFHQK